MTSNGFGLAPLKMEGALADPVTDGAEMTKQRATKVAAMFAVYDRTPTKVQSLGKGRGYVVMVERP